MPSPVICVLDTETTGLDPANDAIVEFAACVVQMTDGAWAPSEVFSRFVHPGMPIPPESSAIHHIVDVDVADAAPWPMSLTRLGSGSRAVALRRLCLLLITHHSTADFWARLRRSIPRSPGYVPSDWPIICCRAYRPTAIKRFGIGSSSRLSSPWPLHVADAPTLIAPRATRLSRLASCATSSGWRGPAFPRSAGCANWPNTRRPPTSSSACRLASTRGRLSRIYQRTISTGSSARRRTRTSFLPLRTGGNCMPRLVRKPFKPPGKTRRFPIPPNRRHQDRRRREERRPPRAWEDCGSTTPP